jgi:phosphatidyl-myo-inositol alpha-mannosyltransferase
VRVAIVCPYAWDRPGGVQSHVRALAPALRARGHEVIVVAPRVSPSRSTDQDGAIAAGRAIAIPANGSVAPISFGPGAAAAVGRILNEHDPEVVHLHEPLIPSLSLLALRSCSGPSIGTFHAAAEASLGYRIAAPALTRAWAKLGLRTAVSDAARALAAQYFPGHYHLTPNGIDVDRFSTASPVDLGPGKKVLFFSRIERRKGLEVLIQAMTRVRDLEATLVVAGDGPRARKSRQLAERLQVKAHWLGAVHEDMKASIYRTADVFCAPGLGRESFGIVLLEAMAAGAPVVCSDIVGFRSAAKGTAEMVPAGDPGRLAHALRTVLTDDARANSMRTAGSRTATMFDWSRLVVGVEGLYERARSGDASSLGQKD